MESEFKTESIVGLVENFHNSETSIIATIARMNPPTPGHLLLVERMLLEAASIGLTQISIILSHSVDSDENPLDCWTKRDIFLQASIERLKTFLISQNPTLAENIKKINVVIVCMNDPFEEEVAVIDPKTTPILKAINYLLFRFYMYPREDITIKLFVGDDRDYSKFLIPSLLSKEIPVGFEQVELERIDMRSFKSMKCPELMALDMDSVPMSAMSASFVRNLIKCRLPEQFAKVMKKVFLNDAEIGELYATLTDAIAENQSLGGANKHKKSTSTFRKSTFRKSRAKSRAKSKSKSTFRKSTFRKSRAKSRAKSKSKSTFRKSRAKSRAKSKSKYSSSFFIVH